MKLITFFFFLSLSAAFGQTTLPSYGLEDYSGSYKDYLLTQQSPNKYIRFKLKGGDGGTAQIDDSSAGHGTKSCFAYGGGGAIVEALFEVGSGAGQLQPGSTIRFIAGGKGGKATLATIVGGTAAGGGGGGTAVLYKAKGSNNWIILAVAGGGGGAYQGSFWASCKDGNSGGMGRTVTNGGSGRGSLSGDGGGTSGSDGGKGGGSIGDGDLSGGGGGATDNGKGGSSTEGFAGGSMGGKGGSGQRGGGFGFGGGGAADESGGGGGGYSGGGGGGMTGAGGGGGSYVNPDYALEQLMLEFNMDGKLALNGFVEYQYTYAGISMALVPSGSAYSGKDLHAEWMTDDASTDADILVRDYNANDPTDNERWYYDDFARAFRLFKNPNKCLDLAEMSTNGARVYLHQCHGKTNQQWTFGNNLIKLQDDQNKCLILKDGAGENENFLTVWDCSAATQNQKAWIVRRHTYNPQTTEPAYKNRDWYRFGLAKTIQLAGNIKCIENKTGQTGNGNNIQIATCSENSLERQRWILDNSSFRLAVAPDKCIDLASSNTTNGTNIQLWDCNGTKAQSWIYDVAAQAIRSGVNFNKCLDLTQSNTADGSNIQLYQCNNTGAQKWVIDEIPSTMPAGANNRIHLTLDSSKCVDIKDAHTTNGTNIQVKTCTSGNAQYFLFDGRRIKMQAAPDKCISPDPNSAAGSAPNVILLRCDETNLQEWTYDGFSQAFRSAVNTNMCLDVDHSNTADGTNIQLFNCNGTEAQQFLLEN
ncbi:MAG: ricin-type beta-trefoil lectin domain protein [Lewinellaceae bacterium]|nr:ricin-type beta-trefoil lectin domain protein [Lewinellaceae bacterium]